jgi:hypothetical protein
LDSQLETSEPNVLCERVGATRTATVLPTRVGDDLSRNIWNGDPFAQLVRHGPNALVLHHVRKPKQPKKIERRRRTRLNRYGLRPSAIGAYAARARSHCNNPPPNG